MNTYSSRKRILYTHIALYTYSDAYLFSKSMSRNKRFHTIFTTINCIYNKLWFTIRFEGPTALYIIQRFPRAPLGDPHVVFRSLKIWWSIVLIHLISKLRHNYRYSYRIYVVKSRFQVYFPMICLISIIKSAEQTFLLRAILRSIHVDDSNITRCFKMQSAF